MVRAELREALERDLGAPIGAVEAVSGGDINEAWAVRVGGERCFVKSNSDAPADLFAREASALRRLREAGALRVPEVIACGAEYLVLEWIASGRRGPDFGARFGEALAALHASVAAEPVRYGLDEDNYIGSLPQPNGWCAHWTELYGRQRIGAQLDIGEARGTLPRDLIRPGWALVERLEALLPATPRPALLHGDLWSGNYMVDDTGAPVLVDPALYVGHREVELAFTELFGGFPDDFYAAYRATWPLRPGYAERRGLYQLYPILVHANLFGGGYVARARELVRRYSGAHP
jgi:protein-ribulosamine 3-kinase